MVGLEYGRRSVLGEGVILPMACLNRVWCCGFHVSVGHGAQDRVSGSVRAENHGLGRQKGSLRVSTEVLSKLVQAPGIGARFRAQIVEPLRAGRNDGAMCRAEGSESVSASEEIQNRVSGSVGEEIQGWSWDLGP